MTDTEKFQLLLAKRDDHLHIRVPSSLIRYLRTEYTKFRNSNAFKGTFTDFVIGRLIFQEGEKK